MVNYNDENYLSHYGILGMKWGVRRYQNADGSLTALGKKREARIAESDNRYREKQKIKTAKYYDKNRRKGFLGMDKEEGIASLERKMASESVLYDKTIIKGKLEAKKAMKELELKKVSEMTHDQIERERMTVGKAAVKDALITIGVNSVLIPSTGLMYIHTTNQQQVRSQHRLEEEDK